MPRPARKTRARPAAESTETRAADHLTAAWMFSVFIALLCELFSAAAMAFSRLSEILVMLGALLLFTALVVGLISLLLAGVVLSIRRQAPPRGVTVFALVVGAAPLLVLLLKWLV